LVPPCTRRSVSLSWTPASLYKRKCLPLSLSLSWGLGRNPESPLIHSEASPSHTGTWAIAQCLPVHTEAFHCLCPSHWGPGEKPRCLLVHAKASHSCSPGPGWGGGLPRPYARRRIPAEAARRRQVTAPIPHSPPTPAARPRPHFRPCSRPCVRQCRSRSSQPRPPGCCARPQLRPQPRCHPLAPQG
jgi:hypothetical protein